MAQEQKKNLNPTSINKRLEDYAQMLKYYTLMKMKNKMKDIEAEFKNDGRLQRNILQKSWRRI
jgi:hypothetical protein